MNRRALLGSVGGALATGFAGCVGERSIATGRFMGRCTWEDGPPHFSVSDITIQRGQDATLEFEAEDVHEIRFNRLVLPSEEHVFRTDVVIPQREGMNLDPEPDRTVESFAWWTWHWCTSVEGTIDVTVSSRAPTGTYVVTDNFVADADGTRYPFDFEVVVE